MADDGYNGWYARKLWQTLPGIYRALDAQGDAPGPLQELVSRIGAQMAATRRGIDALWMNQSIEACDDWAIPYIGDLLATRMVACLDARGQRLDVAKTIYYRRRGGTVGLLEELAADIAGHDARVVEFFRRLGRTRHNFDPPIGLTPGPPAASAPPRPAVLEGLVGAWSRTPAGGFADLRNRYAAGNTNTAFDEFAHIAELRRGGQSAGWYNIPDLGVFLWWLRGYPVTGATPVSNGASTACYSFDPTGRTIPLFAPSSRNAESWGEHWVSPDEWELPVAVRDTLWRATPDNLYPLAFQVMLGGATLPRSNLRIHPQRGVFSFSGTPPVGSLTTAYHFGFASSIGAGGVDQRILPSIPIPTAITEVTGGTGLDAALSGLSEDATITIADSLTYSGPAAALTVPAGKTVVLAAANQQRPVLRWNSGGAWIIHGDNSSVTLQGVLLQGADIVLTGSFESVRLRLATLDPGTSAAPSALFATAIDGLKLQPTMLWIEGTVAALTVERSILGPVRTRNGGAVQQLTAIDSILQSIPTHAVTAGAPVLDPANLAAQIKAGTDPLSIQLRAALPTAELTELQAYTPGTVPSTALLTGLESALASLSRAALESLYPLALADLALGFDSGTVSLARCTVLGPCAVHRIDASECILHDIVTAEDPQDGCVRFSAYARGSALYQPYRSVAIAPRGPVFATRLFGQPAYARLRRDADRAILAPQPGDTILGGARNGSEIGAFALERITLKRRGLAQKYQEFMPIGQIPVWIDAD